MKQIPNELLPTLETLVSQSIAAYQQIVQMTDKELALFVANVQGNEFLLSVFETLPMEEVIQDIKVKELITGTKFSSQKMLDDLLAINAILEKDFIET